jgi:hypothetical protein
MNIEHLPAYPQRDCSLLPSAYLAIGRSLVFNIYSVSLVSPPYSPAVAVAVAIAIACVYHLYYRYSEIGPTVPCI